MLDRSKDAQDAEPGETSTVQASVWRATGFDSSMIDVSEDTPSKARSKGSRLEDDELAGAIAGWCGS
jgi:hypothetical protein